MPVSEQTYERIALEDPERQWELHDGRLQEKPATTFAHNQGMMLLGYQLLQQLDQDAYVVRINAGRLQHADIKYYVPDVSVIPVDYTKSLRGRPDMLEVYDQPLPFVAEVWSPLTGDYDVDAKLPEYERRGDLEIWRLHPYDRTLVARRRQPDGTYTETTYHGGTVNPVALPGVTIDLDALFD